jgi:hypothetical protein
MAVDDLRDRRAKRGLGSGDLQYRFLDMFIASSHAETVSLQL